MVKHNIIGITALYLSFVPLVALAVGLFLDAAFGFNVNCGKAFAYAILLCFPISFVLACVAFKTDDDERYAGGALSISGIFCLLWVLDWLMDIL